MARETMRAFLFGAAVAAVLAAPGCLNDVVLSRDRGAALDAGSDAADASPRSGVTTLFARDPLRSTYDFLRADYGAVIQAGEVRNAGAHLAFGTYEAGAFTVAIQGGDTGAIVDLGSDAEVAARIGARETVGGGQGFAGLALEGAAFNDARADVLFTTPLTPSASAAVGEGHVYVLRVLETTPVQVDLVVKLLVVALDGGKSVAFQWIRLA